MTLKHKVKFFIGNIKRKFSNKKTIKKVVKEKKEVTFLSHLQSRLDDLEKSLNNLHGFTDAERKMELMVRERIDEVTEIIGAYSEYGEK